LCVNIFLTISCQFPFAATFRNLFRIIVDGQDKLRHKYNDIGQCNKLPEFVNTLLCVTFPITTYYWMLQAAGSGQTSTYTFENIIPGKYRGIVILEYCLHGQNVTLSSADDSSFMWILDFEVWTGRKAKSVNGRISTLCWEVVMLIKSTVCCFGCVIVIYCIFHFQPDVTFHWTAVSSIMKCIYFRDAPNIPLLFIFYQTMAIIWIFIFM